MPSLHLSLILARHSLWKSTAYQKPEACIEVMNYMLGAAGRMEIVSVGFYNKSSSGYMR